MITSAKYINYFIESINILRQEIISKNQLGLTDENIYFENFICEILNKIYSYDLKNLNEEKTNYPGIDLGNKKNGIGFQITSTRTSKKINDTILKVTNDKHKVYETYNKLKIFIITNKQTDYSLTKFDKQKIEFDYKQDILDFDDLYQKSLYLTIEKQKELVDYVHKQIPDVSEKIGLDYYNPDIIKRITVEFEEDKWVTTNTGAEYVIEHDFGYIPSVSVLNIHNQEVISQVTKDEKYVTIAINMKSFKGKVIIT